MANAAMIDLWNDANAKRWLGLRPRIQAELGEYGAAALEALAPARGEKALDVGCGCGETTALLALATGDALGVDISGPLLEVARREAPAGARYLQADAQTHRFDAQFDLLFSRFGVMFFDDPQAAFANLCSALRQGGRLAVIVWGDFEQNEWARMPLRLLQRYLPAPEPSGPGPFGLSDRARLLRILQGAGFSRVGIAEVRRPFPGDASLLLQTGPAAGAMRAAGEQAEKLRPQLEAELSHQLAGRTELPGLALLATAVRP